MKSLSIRPFFLCFPPILSLLIGALSGSTSLAAQAVRPAPHPAEIAWGKAENGLQAGLRVSSASLAYTIRQKVTLEVVVRNISKEPITFSHLQDVVMDRQTGDPVAGMLYEFPPVVLDRAGKHMDIALGEIRLGEVPTQTETIAPGKDAVIGRLTLTLAAPNTKASLPRPILFVTPGVYTVSQSFFFQRKSGVNEHLTTGPLKLTTAAGGKGTEPPLGRP
jgi:hypothetical protein